MQSASDVINKRYSNTYDEKLTRIAGADPENIKQGSANSTNYQAEPAQGARADNNCSLTL